MRVSVKSECVRGREAEVEKQLTVPEEGIFMMVKS